MVVGQSQRIIPANLVLNSFEMTAGESGLGKSTLINTLFNTPLYAKKHVPEPNADRSKTVTIESITAGKIKVHSIIPEFLNSLLSPADIEENGVRLRLTVVDTPGYGDFINNEEG